MPDRLIPRQEKLEGFVASGNGAAEAGNWISAARAWLEAAKLDSQHASGLLRKAAVPRLEALAEDGDPEAQALLAGILMEYYNESALPYAVTHATRAAEHGNAEAIRTLGFMYARGLGVTQNFDRAAELWRDALQRGDGYAAFDLASLHISGDVPLSSEEECENLLVLAARRGITMAGAVLFTRLAKADRDAEALSWVVWTAERGYVRAMFAAGRWYRDGIGTTADPVEALRWFFTMFDHGSADGIHEAIQLAESGMTEDQIRQAAERAGRPGDADVTIQTIQRHRDQPGHA